MHFCLLAFQLNGIKGACIEIRFLCVPPPVYFFPFPFEFISPLSALYCTEKMCQAETTILTTNCLYITIVVFSFQNNNMHSPINSKNHFHVLELTGTEAKHLKNGAFF